MNFQNIPRSDKVIKKGFVPKLDALLFFDYAQIELRLLAFYMASLGDDSMAAAIRAGKDLHTESAKAALGLEVDPSDQQRQVGKVLNFSLVYGGGRPTIMRQLGVTFPEATKLLRLFHKRWPGIQIVVEAINQKIAAEGYIKTLWGRHLHPESEHKRLNALVQGCAADLMRNSLVTVDKNLRENGYVAHLVSVIHDELIIDAPFDEVDALTELVPAWMDWEPVSVVVPVETAAEWSTTTWADKVPYDKEALLSVRG
ncbi:MAG TPA: DNA polymerase [Candidatus Paceibacterota bacterium]